MDDLMAFKSFFGHVYDANDLVKNKYIVNWLAILVWKQQRGFVFKLKNG